MAASTDRIFPAAWGISNPALLVETFSSRIWKVALPDGEPAIVKSLKDFSDAYDELRGAYYLRWRAGVGAVKLLAWHGSDMLLEFAGERLLADVAASEGDNAATEIAADALQRLFSHSDQPLPPEFQPLRERFAGLFAKASADSAANQHSIYIEAATLADELLSNQRDIRPLHGDLHHDNLIYGPRGWLAIDAKGVLGDPAYDAANWFSNPLDQRNGLCLNHERIAFMAGTFGKALGQSPARILDFAFAYCCLSASWHAEDGNDQDEMLELNVARAIRTVRSTF